MATSVGKIETQVLVRWGGKDFHIGDLTLDVKIVNGKPRIPTEREIRSTLRRGLK